jgi:hypothetical protein
MLDKPRAAQAPQCAQNEFGYRLLQSREARCGFISSNGKREIFAMSGDRSEMRIGPLDPNVYG